MPYFLCKLIPPRRTFQTDMSEAERRLKRHHSEYWSGLLNRGTVLLFGPVNDPAGPYGICVLAIEKSETPEGTSNMPL